MKKLGLIIAISIVCSINVTWAQTIDSENKQSGVFESPGAIRKPIDGAYEKHITPNNKPVPLQPINEEYVMYATLIWRVIDLKEKFNLPLYFPTEPKGNWKSLSQTVWDAVDSSENNPMPVRIYSTEYFDVPLSNEEFRGKFSIEPRIQQIWLTDEFGMQVFDEETGEPISIGDTTIMQYADPKDIMQYDIKEQYFVDNQRSMLDVRILGICPILLKGGTDMLEDMGFSEEEEAPPAAAEDEFFEDEFADELTDEFADDEFAAEPKEEYQAPEELPEMSPQKLAPIGWLYYPEFRPVMAKTEVFNAHNNAQRRTYDDIFLQRHFSSFIRAEENVYDNREIFFYIVNGLDQILEAERIKNKIFAFEQEMWEY
jgi:gliding motility associated protien GldN